MESITISFSNKKKFDVLVNFLKSFDYIEIQQEKELTAKQEHEEMKQIMLESSKRFVTNYLLQNESESKANS